MSIFMIKFHSTARVEANFQVKNEVTPKAMFMVICAANFCDYNHDISCTLGKERESVQLHLSPVSLPVRLCLPCVVVTLLSRKVCQNFQTKL